MAEAGDFHKIGNISGSDGVGVPTGGVQGDVLQKVGGSDFATAWAKMNYAQIEGKVPASALPQISTEPFVVKSQAEMLNLPAVPGRMAIRTDAGKTFILSGLPASTLANWVELTTTSDVQSVNQKTGNVVLNKADIGLDKVNNTADSDKPVATTTVAGNMSAADKVKLNNATAASTASRMVIRDSAGKAAFKGVTLDNAPSVASDGATKGYVDSTADGRVKILGVLGAGLNLNDCKENAVGVQTASANVTAALNYPEPTAGALQVITSGGMVYQFYTTYHTSATKIYWRTFYSNSWGAWKRIVDTSMLADEVAAGVKPANFQLNELQGGHVLTKSIPSGVGWTAGTLGDDWDGLRSYAQTGVVEGWVKGCPVGGAINTTHNLSAGFVKDPVWKLEVRPEGLNYVTQRATLLNCAPSFMVGFVWERVYNPVTAKWSVWACVGGDTGTIYSVGKSVNTVSIDEPVIHPKSTDNFLYESSRPHTIRRTGDTIKLGGAASTKLYTNLDSTTGPAMLWTAVASQTASGVPGVDYTFMPDPVPPRGGSGVQQSSSSDRYYAFWDGNNFRASRYGPRASSGNVWLPFDVTYSPPRMNTYSGPGFVPPVLGTQTGTPSS